jgi:hypothetical protein
MPDTRKPGAYKGPSEKGYKATPDETKSPAATKPSPAASAKEPAPVKPAAEKDQTPKETETPKEPPVYTATMDKPRSGV